MSNSTPNPCPAHTKAQTRKVTLLKILRRSRRRFFIWRRHGEYGHGADDLRFLRTRYQTFCRSARRCWNEADGQIQTTLHWLALSDAERDAAAFSCVNGDWEQLREIAALVFQVRLSRLKPPPQNGCRWDFVAYGCIEVGGAPLNDDLFLFEWRAALVSVFQPNNVDEAGTMIGERAVCVWSFIGQDERRAIVVDAMSQHEIIEAHLQLRVWAQAHFPAGEVERLFAIGT